MAKMYEIIVGLKDKESRIFETSIEKAKTEFVGALSSFEIDFSLAFQKGGYLSKSGNFIQENSLKLTIIGYENETKINDFIREVKQYYNQETVLVISKNIEATFRS